MTPHDHWIVLSCHKCQLRISRNFRLESSEKINVRLAAPRATVPQSVQTYVTDTPSRRENPDHKKLSRASSAGLPEAARSSFGFALGDRRRREKRPFRFHAAARCVVSPVSRQSHVTHAGWAFNRARAAPVRASKHERARGERCRKSLTDRAMRSPTSSSSWVGAVSENRRSRYNSSK